MRMLSLLIFVLGVSIPVFAQPFSSGSNGSDGAYAPTQSGDFDPVALGLDLDGDNVFHFTTVNIPTGVTIRLRAWKMRRPNAVYFLATGNVTIAGTLQLSGEDGTNPSVDTRGQRLSEPGPGGYPGGSGGKIGDTTTVRRGYGPGSATWPCTPAYFSVLGHPTTLPPCNQPATPYGNSMLLQLVGGSGGAGGPGFSGSNGGRGGAGGGAIRIASSSLINVNSGAILANGGAVFFNIGGCFRNSIGGTGGAIHLSAPTMTLSGATINANGALACETASLGRIRIDAINPNTAGANLSPVPAVGPLVNLPPPPIPASLRFVTIGGVSVPANPGASFAVPDVAINSTGAPTLVQIGASGIPLGTPLSLIIEAEGATPDQLVTTSGLTGSLASSAATASVTFPAGLQRLYLRVVW